MVNHFNEDVKRKRLPKNTNFRQESVEFCCGILLTSVREEWGGTHLTKTKNKAIQELYLSADRK